MKEVTGEYFSWGRGELALLKENLEGDLSYACLFDFPQGTEESCKLEVICLKGEPAFLFHCNGDRNEYDDVEVVNIGHVREIATVIFANRMTINLAMLAARQLEGRSGDDAIDVVLSRNSYLENTYNGTFMVGNPRGTSWAFEQFARTHSAVFFSTEEDATPVLDFKGWAHKRSQSYFETDSDQLCVVLTAAGEVTIDSRSLIFSRAKQFDKDHLQELKEAIYMDDFFVVTEVAEVNPNRHGKLTRSLRQALSCLQHTRGEYRAERRLIVADVATGHEFRSGEERISGKLSLEHRYLRDCSVISSNFASNEKNSP